MPKPRDLLQYGIALHRTILLQENHDSSKKQEQTIEDLEEGLQPKSKEQLRCLMHGIDVPFEEWGIDLRMFFALSNDKSKREDPLHYSNLPAWLEQETWSPTDAILILAGLDPIGALIEWSHQNSQGAHINSPRVINASWFFDTANLYDYEIDPSRESSFGDRKLLAEKIKRAEFLKTDPTAIFKKEMLSARTVMLAALKKRWDNGSQHPEQKQTPKFFIDWALKRGFEIEWTEWANEQGYIEGEPDVTEPPFFDADADDYPKLLHIAVRAWEHAKKSAQDRPKESIISYLEQRYPSLSKAEKNAVALIANWSKRGGRPRENK